MTSGLPVSFSEVSRLVSPIFTSYKGSDDKVHSFSNSNVQFVLSKISGPTSVSIEAPWVGTVAGKILDLSPYQHFYDITLSSHESREVYGKLAE